MTSSAAGWSALAARAARHLPFEWWPRLSRVNLAIPYYHMVSDAHVPHVSPLYRFRNTREFRADLDFLLARFEPVTLDDVIDAVDGRRTFRRPSFHLTFDDGFREMHDVVAPILAERGVPATFFVNTAFLDEGGLAHHNGIAVILDRLAQPVAAAMRARLEAQLPSVPAADTRSRLLAIRYRDRALVPALAGALEVDLGAYVTRTKPYLSSAQVADLLRRGFTIGGHSHDHPLYADLSLDEQLAQTREVMTRLRGSFGLLRNAFAFPHTGDGVGAEFFETVFSDGTLDVCFGTGGLLRHFHPRNLERVSMEKTAAPAADIFARQYARAVYANLKRA